MNGLTIPNRKYAAITVAIFFVIVIVGSVFLFIFKNAKNSEEVVGGQITTATSSMLIIATDKRFKLADQLYKEGRFQEAYDEFDNTINRETINGNPDGAPIETLKLYKIASLRELGNESFFKEYYDFYKDTNNSLLNRAYVLLDAQQVAIVEGNSKKLLFIFTEQEKKELNLLNERDINYEISRKIFTLYPFPVTAARLADYEISKLDPNKSDSKLIAREIYDKYMYGFNQELKYMQGEDGLRHIVANSVMNKGILMSRMEDFGLILPKSTAESFLEAIEYAKLYSQTTTHHFTLLNLLNHQIKVNNQSEVDKLLKALEEEKLKIGISKWVRGVYLNNTRLQNEYPHLYKKIQSSKEFRSIMDNIFSPN